MKAIFFLLFSLVTLSFAASASELMTRKGSECVIEITCR